MQYMEVLWARLELTGLDLLYKKKLEVYVQYKTLHKYDLQLNDLCLMVLGENKNEK